MNILTYLGIMIGLNVFYSGWVVKQSWYIPFSEVRRIMREPIDRRDKIDA